MTELVWSSNVEGQSINQNSHEAEREWMAEQLNACSLALVLPRATCS